MSIKCTVIATELLRRHRIDGEIMAVSGSPLLIFIDADCFLNRIGRSVNDCKRPPPVVNLSQNGMKCGKHWNHSKSIVGQHSFVVPMCALEEKIGIVLNTWGMKHAVFKFFCTLRHNAMKHMIAGMVATDNKIINTGA